MKLNADKDGEELKHFLVTNLNISGNRAKQLIDSKQVFVNDRRVWIAGYQLAQGDVVIVPDTASAVAQPKTIKISYKIIYEDDNIIAVNKPTGVLADKDPKSMEAMLRRDKNMPVLRAIHRLDRDTTGAILYAKNDEVYGAYREMWHEKPVEKVYYAISLKEANFDEQEIETAVDDKLAASKVKLMAKGRGLSVFRVTIKTGRKHQIRVHLASIGHPVAGDKEYGPKVVHGDWQKNLTRQMLHAYELRFNCPVSGVDMDIRAYFPEDFLELAGKAGFTV
ncbi:MAG: RluA family pseudouridine synthase [Spirochaetia bacterium]|nr:RluA family pseudouridine synthase [Spirochaetia bacterium]